MIKLLIFTHIMLFICSCTPIQEAEAAKVAIDVVEVIVKDELE